MADTRDMRGWMRTIERRQSEQRTAVSGVQTRVAEVRQEIKDLPIAGAKVPVFPVEIEHGTALYPSATGRQRARLLVDFPDVTKATDGTDLTVTSYELWGYDTGIELEPDTVPVFMLTGTSGASAFRTDEFAPGAVWVFKIRAVAGGTPGEFSEEFTAVMAADTTPPPQPTPPIVESRRGTLVVTSDGRAVTGEMPADFSHLILAHGVESSPTTEVARFGRTGGIWIMDAPYFDPQYFRLRAVDEAGNLGPWSAQAVNYTEPLVDADIVLSELDAAVTHLKNIDAGVSILEDTIITEHLKVTESMTAKIAQFLVVKADMVDVNDLWADTAFFGKADALLFRGTAFEGKQFTGGRFTGSLFETDIEDLTGIKWDATGIRAWNVGGQSTFALDAATGDLAINGGTFTGAFIRTAELGARTELTKDGLRQLDATGKELVKLGYGLATGLAVLNPATNVLVALDKMVFGSYRRTMTADKNWGTTAERFPKIVYNSSLTGTDVVLYDWDNYSGTDAASGRAKRVPLRFTASSNRHLLTMNLTVFSDYDRAHYLSLGTTARPADPGTTFRATLWVRKIDGTGTYKPALGQTAFAPYMGSTTTHLIQEEVIVVPGVEYEVLVNLRIDDNVTVGSYIEPAQSRFMSQPL